MRLTQFKKPLYLFRGSPVPAEWDDYDDADLIRRIVEGKAEVSTIGFISDAEPPSAEYLYPHFHVQNPGATRHKPNLQTKQQEEFEEKEHQKQVEKEQLADREWDEEELKILERRALKKIEKERQKQIALSQLEAAYIKAMLDDDTLY